MQESAALARRLDLQLHTHLAETTEEGAYCHELYGCTPVEYLESLGWLAGDVWCAHCVHLTAGEVTQFARTGTGVAHCPTSNLRLGAGVAPVRDMLDAGVRVGLGVDGSASNERGDLLFEVKQALLVARGRGGPRAMTVRDALRIGTRGGAAVLGQADIGSLEPGKRADLAVWRIGRPGARRSRRSRFRPRPLGAAPGRPAVRGRRGGRPRRAPPPGGRGRDRAPTADASEKIRLMLSTHVLDTANGGPAAGVRVELFRGDDLVASAETDADGRIRELADVAAGTYRLVFHPPSPFFTRVELQLELGDGDHHVPLLVSPYSCATYRGS